MLFLRERLLELHQRWYGVRRLCVYFQCVTAVWLPRRNDTNRGGINKYLCTKEGVDWFGELRTARPHLGDWIPFWASTKQSVPGWGKQERSGNLITCGDVWIGKKNSEEAFQISEWESNKTGKNVSSEAPE